MAKPTPGEVVIARDAFHEAWDDIEDWDVCYSCLGAGYHDGGDMQDDEPCHACDGEGTTKR